MPNTDKIHVINSIKVMGILSEEATLLFLPLSQQGSTLIGKNLLLEQILSFKS